MKSIFIILLITSIIIETTIFAFPLTLIVVSVLCLKLGSKFTPWAFLAGLLLDLFALRPLGLTSVIFLVFCWIIGRYKKKVPVGNIVYFLVFLTCAATLYSLLFYSYLTYQNLLGVIVVGSLLHEIFLRLMGATFAGDKKLRVFEA